MNIIPQNKTSFNTLEIFWLHFKVKREDSTDWMAEGLPEPTLIYHTPQGNTHLCWAVNGYFASTKSRDFLNDVVARFLLTFKSAERLPYEPNEEMLKNNFAHYTNKAHELKEVSKGLRSASLKKYAPRRADKFDDYTFWAIKLYAEDLIKASGGAISYYSLEKFAMDQFRENKELSTIRAKCVSVFNWYEERDWEIPKRNKFKTKEDYYMSQVGVKKPHIAEANKARKKERMRRVENLLTGKYANDFKKKAGSWHMGKIAKELNLHRETVSSLIKEIKNNGGLKS